MFNRAEEEMQKAGDTNGDEQDKYLVNAIQFINMARYKLKEENGQTRDNTRNDAVRTESEHGNGARSENTSGHNQEA